MIFYSDVPCALLINRQDVDYQLEDGHGYPCFYEYGVLISVVAQCEGALASIRHKPRQLGAMIRLRYQYLP